MGTRTTKRKRARYVDKEKVLAMAKCGLGYREIMDVLGISRASVRKVLSDAGFFERKREGRDREVQRMYGLYRQKEIAQRLGISLGTVGKIIQELKAGGRLNPGRVRAPAHPDKQKK